MKLPEPTLVFESALAILCLCLFRESHPPKSILFASALIALGILIGLIWVLVVARNATAVEFPDITAMSGRAIAMTFMVTVVAAPLYEEKVVRHLLFDGLAEVSTPLISALIISTFFAIAHVGSMIWAFFVSMTLCYLKVRLKLNTFQLAAVHGAINFVILAWYFTKGFSI